MLRLLASRWNKRTVLMALFALLWSQFALAVHAIDCEPTNSAAAFKSQAKCHESDDEHVDATCVSHCGSDYSADSKRLPLLESQPQHAVAWLTPLKQSRRQTQPLPNPHGIRYWHSPTGHPASILLI